MVWKRVLLSLLCIAHGVPPTTWLRFHGEVGGETLRSSSFLVSAATSDTAVFGSTDVAYAFDGDQNGDLDFDFELDVDDVASMSTRKFGSKQQHVEVETDAAGGGDVGHTSRRPLQKIAPKTFNFGRGVGYVATTVIESQEPLFSVPMQQTMSLASAKRGRIGVLLDANPDLPPSIALAVHLLEERFLGVHSNFSEYIERLPPIEAINSTIFYTEDELAMLQGSQIHRVTMARVNAVENFYSALVGPVTSLAVDPPLFSKDEFTLENFRWAMGVVWSHAFPVGTAEKEVVLAPVLDTIGVCLHESHCPKNRIELHAATQQLVVYASKDYAVGEEIVMDMGEKASTMFMLNHGFTRPVPSQALDQVDISILLDPNDTLVDVKLFLLQSQNMSMDDSYVLHYGGDALDDKMTTSLKIKLMQGYEVGRFKDLLGVAQGASAEYTEPRHIVSLRNEYVFTRALLLTCKNLLQQYPTTLEHDQARLEAMKDHLSASREAHIVRMLVLEKQIIHHAMQLAQQQWTDLLFSDHPNLLRTD